MLSGGKKAENTNALDKNCLHIHEDLEGNVEICLVWGRHGVGFPF